MSEPPYEAHPAAVDPTTSGPDGGARVQLLVLLAVAALARAYRLDGALWYDEIVTLVEYVRLAPSELLTTYTSSNNHVLYSLLAHASIAALGETASALRLPAAALGVASLAAFWWMAHELARPREARLASWLVALSYHHVWFSQNARGYTGILFFTWLGTALFLRARRGGTGALWIAYALTLALGAWTHLSALLVFAAHAVVYVAQELRHRGEHRSFDARPLGAFALGGALVLLLYAALLPEVWATLTIQSRAAEQSTTVASWKDPLWTVRQIARALPLGLVSLPVGVAALGIAGVGLAEIARRRPFDALLLVLPAVITLAALIAARFNIWPRYFLVSLGFAALAGVHGLFVVADFVARARPDSRWWKPSERIASAACIAVIAASAATVTQNYRFPKQDYPGARTWLLERKSGGEPVLTAGLASYSYGRYYEPAFRALENVEQLDRLQSTHPRLWLVYSFPTHLRAARPELYSRIESDFEPVKLFPGTIGDGDVRVVRSAGTDGQPEGP